MTVEPWIIEAFEKKLWLPTRGGDRVMIACINKPGSPVLCYDEYGDYWSVDGNGLFAATPGMRKDLLPPKRTFDVCVWQATDGNICFDEWKDREYYESRNWTLLARATITEGDGL